MDTNPGTEKVRHRLTQTRREMTGPRPENTWGGSVNGPALFNCGKAVFEHRQAIAVPAERLLPSCTSAR